MFLFVGGGDVWARHSYSVEARLLRLGLVALRVLVVEAHVGTVVDTKQAKAVVVAYYRDLET